MIEWVEFSNVKALRKTKLPLSRFTLIVGANGSGKSTALHAILALHNPGNWNVGQVRTAGVSEHEPVTLTAKWREQNNDYMVNAKWGRSLRRGLSARAKTNSDFLAGEGCSSNLVGPHVYEG